MLPRHTALQINLVLPFQNQHLDHLFEFLCLAPSVVRGPAVSAWPESFWEMQKSGPSPTLNQNQHVQFPQVTLTQVQVWETLSYFLFQTFPLISNSGSNLETGHLLPGNVLPKFHLQIQNIFYKVPHPSVLRFKFMSCLWSLPQTFMCILYFCVWVPGGCNYSWLSHHIYIVPKSCLPRIMGNASFFLT